MTEITPESQVPQIKIINKLSLSGEALNSLRESKQLQHMGESCLVPVPPLEFMRRVVELENRKSKVQLKNKLNAVNRVTSLSSRYSSSDRPTQSKMLDQVNRDQIALSANKLKI